MNSFARQYLISLLEEVLKKEVENDVSSTERSGSKREARRIFRALLDRLVEEGGEGEGSGGVGVGFSFGRKWMMKEVWMKGFGAVDL